MILLDYSQVIFGQVFTDLNRNGGTISIDLVRHLTLNQIAYYNKRFRHKYGKMIICLDSRRGYWRKKAFEYYKWKRSQDRDDSDIDWQALFKDMNQIRDEIVEQIPMLAYEVDYCEADDLIAALVREFRDEKTLIVSSDKDFKQLQSFSHVDQYSPITKKFLKCEDPDFYRFEHTIKGDPGDGIPNIYTRRDFFPAKEDGLVKRQTPVMAKKTKELYRRYIEGEPIEEMLTEEQHERWKENRRLVDLIRFDNNIDGVTVSHTHMIDEFFRQIEKHEKTHYNLYKYMMNNRLRILMENIEEFQNTNDFPTRGGSPANASGEGLESFMQ